MSGNKTDYSEKNKQQANMEAQLRVHLKKKELDISEQEQIKLLKKKARHKWWHLAINIAAILFFSYSFLFDITRLGDTLYYILLAVFAINAFLILYQQKKIKELIAFLKDENSA